MKLAVESRNVELSGTMRTKEFTVSVGAHIMQVLSGLYSDPVDAMVREYLTNMADAYTALKREHPNASILPAKLACPTALDPTLVFEDFGIGMDVNTVWEIYSSYGTSTKSTSNDEVGAFGLGSKTAFCYNNGSSWMIESRYNGQKHSFMAFVNAKGIPTLTHVSSEPTSEHSGLTIRIPINRTDMKQCEESIKKYAAFFPFPLEVTGTVVSEMKYTMINPDGSWKIAFSPKKEYRPRTVCYILMGNVPYPVTAELYTTVPNISVKNTSVNISSQFAKLYSQSNHILYLNVPIGSVDIVPSRDAIKLTPRSKEAFCAAVTNFFNTFDKALEVSLWESVNVNELFDKFAVAKDFFPIDVHTQTPVNFLSSKAYNIWKHNNIPVYLDNSRVVQYDLPTIEINVSDIPNKKLSFRHFILDPSKAKTVVEVIPSSKIKKLNVGNRFYPNSDLFHQRNIIHNVIVFNDLPSMTDNKMKNLFNAYARDKYLRKTSTGRISTATYGHNHAQFIVIEGDATCLDGLFCTSMKMSDIQDKYGAAADKIRGTSHKGTVNLYRLIPRSNSVQFAARVIVPEDNTNYYIVLDSKENNNHNVPTGLANRIAEIVSSSQYYHNQWNARSVPTLTKIIDNVLPVYGIMKSDVGKFNSKAWINLTDTVLAELDTFFSNTEVLNLFTRYGPDSLKNPRFPIGSYPYQTYPAPAINILLERVFFNKDTRNEQIPVNKQIQKLVDMLEYAKNHKKIISDWPAWAGKDENVFLIKSVLEYVKNLADNKQYPNLHAATQYKEYFTEIVKLFEELPQVDQKFIQYFCRNIFNDSDILNNPHTLTTLSRILAK